MAGEYSALYSVRLCGDLSPLLPPTSFNSIKHNYVFVLKTQVHK